MEPVYKKRKNLLVRGIQQNTSIDTNDFFMHFVERLNHYKHFLSLEKSISINNVLKQKKNTEVCFSGLIFSKKTSKNGHILLEIEDETGLVKVLVNKTNVGFKQAQDLLLDSFIGIKGKVSDDIVFIHTLYEAQVFSPKKQKKLEGKILFVGDGVNVPKIKFNYMFCLEQKKGYYIPKNRRKELPQIPFEKNENSLPNPVSIKLDNGLKLFFYWNKDKNVRFSQICKTGHVSPQYNSSFKVVGEDNGLYIDTDTDIVFVFGFEDKLQNILGTLCVEKPSNKAFLLDLATMSVEDVV